LIKEWAKIEKHKEVKLHFPKINSRRLQLLEMGYLNLREEVDKYYRKRRMVQEGLHNLKRELRLKSFPYRIDCFDISNIQGKDAVAAMTVAIDGEIVIGEGEIDEAPMLYIGEKVGQIYNEEEKDSVTYVDPVDIAVDPVEGTRMTAQGQPNAITVLAVGKKGSFLKAPDMYMEKLIVGPEAKGKIDLSKPLEDNIHAVANALKKELKDLMIVILDKPRHKELIKDLQAMGIKVYALPDGDVAGSILTCMIDSDVDMLYGIGGAPEGVISAAVIRALGGDMQARLKLRSEVKGASLENDKISKFEKLRCEEQGLKVGEILKLEDLAKDDEIIFSATGITGGDLLEGVKRKGSIARTQTLVVRGLSKTIRYINSIHNLDFKDEKITHLVK